MLVEKTEYAAGMRFKTDDMLCSSPDLPSE